MSSVWEFKKTGSPKKYRFDVRKSDMEYVFEDVQYLGEDIELDVSKGLMGLGRKYFSHWGTAKIFYEVILLRLKDSKNIHPYIVEMIKLQADNILNDKKTALKTIELDIREACSKTGLTVAQVYDNLVLLTMDSRVFWRLLGCFHSEVEKTDLVYHSVFPSFIGDENFVSIRITPSIFKKEEYKYLETPSDIDPYTRFITNFSSYAHIGQSRREVYTIGSASMDKSSAEIVLPSIELTMKIKKQYEKAIIEGDVRYDFCWAKALYIYYYLLLGVTENKEKVCIFKVSKIVPNIGREVMNNVLEYNDESISYAILNSEGKFNVIKRFLHVNVVRDIDNNITEIHASLNSQLDWSGSIHREHSWDTVKEARETMKSIGGVYRFVNKIGTTIYVGKSQDFKKRLKTHFNKGHLPREAYAEVEKVEVLKIPSKASRDIIELYYINKFKPKYNLKSKTKDALTINIDDSRYVWADCDFVK